MVAVEPQPALSTTLRLLYGSNAYVVIEAVAVGARQGEVDLLLNLANPSVSTASESFVSAARGAAEWEGQVWDGRVRVRHTTIDALIKRHGASAFIKIDVEGFEADALAGLSCPVPAFSFEFTTIQRAVAQDCLAACLRLGSYRFNAVLGESQRLVLDHWLSANELGRWLDGLPQDANSGGIYAVSVNEPTAGTVP